MTERLTLSEVETALGPMFVITSSRGVVAVGRDPTALSAEVRVRLPAAELEAGPAAPSGRWLRGWDRGERRDLPPVDLRGIAAFDAAVYAAVRDIGWGERATYGDVAVAIGHPGAARAVGAAMGRCPLFPAVPCHRVVRAADGWSGWGGDDALKRRLLDREGG
jgi:O-6-methylguanine DNA methyltransferase